ncbi:MAG: fimbrial assembly protein [Zetaproteobacteria bacterium CG12_big_fil_rev_8_21_14_0_65_54_13]|nr:MAG: fimbrial assembly protein [Zetaproteobacteria bacterium CG23_combo_of_CG06-09_8_20_14_all_54_7]PIW44456.1 MAG: fimbrial assembly protein [Zetaproteobacteria bacterium CG12_big_fil_rev_8_21_14_0_65_54_13]PIX55610.1 MAG: fimbrial assembly protein [Zetaproteobacteria bacterium CG_4_10_14_3_um_filter_54_28]PJA27736.1 MAG: fimbrial assembly protein [Zetaproteobacteria bacterium CG_4_9_14_3_um_filter_54_145]
MKRLTGLMICMALSPAVYAAPESEMPDAMQHLVTAPDIDFANLRDPFASYLARVSSTGKNALLENQLQLSNREREALEGYDLGSLKLVAIFSMGGERVAMIEDSSNKGFIIRRGNYLGKNNGKIEKITGDTVFLVEQVLDPAGDIIDRQVTLTLNEVNQ